MATSTFDKNIVIGKEAAKRLVEALENPTPIPHDRSAFVKNEEVLECLLSNLNGWSKREVNRM
jgi:hypothetical protein